MSVQFDLYSIEQQIEKMKEKGIKFNIINEDAAKEFLKNHNYYFKLGSYRKNYDKYELGVNKGKYVNLEFAYLQELSTIDCHLRYLILELCLDIEHALKLMLINDIEKNPDKDSKNIVQQWDASYSVVSHIYIQKGKSYNRDLVIKYHPEYPIYAILELISFGELCKLIEFYHKKYPKRLVFHTSLLYPIRNLRNACAHNACLINNLRRVSDDKPNPYLLKELQSFKSISNSSINKKLKCQEIHDLMCLIYLYPIVIHSRRQKDKALTLIRDLVESRMRKHRDYFEKNNVISSFYYFTLMACRLLSQKLY